MWESIEITKYVKDSLVGMLSRYIDNKTSSDADIRSAYDFAKRHHPDMIERANKHGMIRLEYHYHEFHDVRSVFTVNIKSMTIFYDGLIPVSQIYRVKSINNMLFHENELREMVDKVNVNIEKQKNTPLTPEILADYGFAQHSDGNAFVNINNPYWAKDNLLLFYTDTPPHNTYLVGHGFTHNGVYFASSMQWIDNLYQFHQAYDVITGKQL